MQIGHQRHLWPIALLKELVDNALDACECADLRPQISVTGMADSLAVSDNGRGIPAEVIQRSIDYSVRVSDKMYYVSPTRGQQGNALKCLWAAPFVATGEKGLVEVITPQGGHAVEVTLDRLRGEPNIAVRTEGMGVVKSGTLFRLHWPEIASYLHGDRGHDFYNAWELLAAYGAFNPHARFSL